MSPDPIGLIAGNGEFPQLFAKSAKAQGVPVVAVAIRGETEPKLIDLVDALTWVRPGQLGKMVRCFKRAGVKRAAMAGGVRKTRLFGHFIPDWQGLMLLGRCVLRPDDGLLRAVAAWFEQSGITIVDSTLYMPEALAPTGVLTTRQPTARQWQDLHYGLKIARAIGELDIGQTVVVKHGAVVALEAIEGTDACIARAGELTKHQNAVVVKVAKPNQDMRFDVPAIGMQTIDSLVAAGIHVLGIEADRTLILKPQQVISTADKQQLIVVGLF